MPTLIPVPEPRGFVGLVMLILLFASAARLGGTNNSVQITMTDYLPAELPPMAARTILFCRGEGSAFASEISAPGHAAAVTGTGTTGDDHLLCFIWCRMDGRAHSAVRHVCLRGQLRQLLCAGCACRWTAGLRRTMSARRLLSAAST